MTVVKGTNYALRVLAGLAVLICSPRFYAQVPYEPKSGGCPEIVVTGPSGVSTPGELIGFIVEVSPEPASNLSYHWSTSSGEVNEGQSTKGIGVRYLMEMRGMTLTATVKVSGLPSHCGDSASENTPLIWDTGPEVISEFWIPITSIHQRNLRRVAAEVKSRPYDQIYIIEYFPSGTSDRSIKLKKSKIMAFLVKTLKVYGPAITIVTAEGDHPHTRIFLIPPGANNPTP